MILLRNVFRPSAQYSCQKKAKMNEVAKNMPEYDLPIRQVFAHIYKALYSQDLNSLMTPQADCSELHGVDVVLFLRNTHSHQTTYIYTLSG